MNSTANHHGLSLVVLRNVPLFSGLEEAELLRLSGVSSRRRAERGRVTVAMVDAEIATLRGQWDAADADGDAALLQSVLPGAILDEFDRAQLAAVIRACRASPSLSAAGRRLFAISREGKTSQNDADRLRKYLARFGLGWSDITDSQAG